MFNKEQYAKNEIALGISILEKFPDDEVQKDRVTYWALQLNDIELADRYATAKYRDIVDGHKRKS